jgi:uncharacterized protein
MACPLRRPATHSLAGGCRAKAPARPDAPYNALAMGTPMGIVRAADWDRERIIPDPNPPITGWAAGEGTTVALRIARFVAPGSASC